MEALIGVDWAEVFVPDTPILEIFVRGTAVYLVLFFLLRLVRRDSGTIGIADLLVIVLIADASQNAMATDYTALTDGLFLVGTIVFWSYALQWAAYHSPAVRRVVDPSPLRLVKDGKMIRANMRRELITEEELMSQLRLQGAPELSKVKEAFVESDGRVSVIPYESQPNQRAPEKKAS